MTNALLKAIAEPERAYKFVARRVRGRFLWRQAYQRLRDPKVEGYVPLDHERADAIASELSRQGVDLRPLAIDLDDYQGFMALAGYHRFPRYYANAHPDWLAEKSLEHYLAAKLLQLSPEDVYLDIANDDSPAPEIYRDAYRCAVFRQDLSFPEGISGNVIGGSAADLPLDPGFASKMALHCSFEHFEGDADIGFIREADRVLRPGGRVCILPLYLFTEYAIQTDPAWVPRRGLEFEPDATLYCARGWGNRHGRFYDVPHFLSRVVGALGTLRLTVFRVTNCREVAPSCYLDFAALLEKE